MYKIIITLALGVFLLAGCEDDSVLLPSGGDFAGGWTSGCQINGTESEKLDLSVTVDAIFSTSNSWLSNTTCSGLSNITFVATTTYVIGAIQNLNAGGTASRIEITDISQLVTPNDPITAVLMNSISFFGFTDWATGVAKEVIGLDSATGVASPVTPEQEILAIDSTVTPNTLYVGDEAAAIDADNYPLDLEPLPEFTRL